MYTIGQAAVRAGVSVELLRAWERRYGIVEPERTASGYRLYDDGAIARLRAMRTLVETGWSPSQAAREVLANKTPIGAGDRSGGPSPADFDPIPMGVSVPELTAGFVEAAAALDEARLDGLLDEMFARGSFERAIEEHVFPALRALGDAWAGGRMSVAAEHAASHAVLRRLAAAFEAAGHAGTGRPILVGLPPGSRHELGAIAFATATRRRGLPVIYLGADVPVDAWKAAIERTDAAAAVLAVPTLRDRKPAREAMRAIQALGRDLVLAVGGAGAQGTDFPSSVLVLQNGIPQEVAALERALGNRSS